MECKIFEWVRNIEKKRKEYTKISVGVKVLVLVFKIFLYIFVYFSKVALIMNKLSKFRI